MAFWRFGKNKKEEQAKQAEDAAQPPDGAEETDRENKDPQEPEGEPPAVDQADAKETDARPDQQAKQERQPEEEGKEAAAAGRPEPEASGEPAKDKAQGELLPETPDEPQVADEPQEGPKKKKPGLFSRMAQRLGKTRDKIGGSIERIALGKKIDDEVLDELEEVLITADMGVPTTMELIEGLRGKVKRKELDDAEALKAALSQGIADILARAPRPKEIDGAPHITMVVGVNGVGKTTTIGKLAHRFTSEGRSVMLAAADTFRAAAAEQLEVWAGRAGAPLVRGGDKADPSSVAYDAVEAAAARGLDMVIIDTAGRLHTQVNLMEELKKIHRVVGKKMEGAPHEVLLVLDATTGQNAISQAKLFNQAVPLDGIILTKLDGTAKGGVVVAIAKEMGLPIKFVGLGEKIEDLRPFEPEEFAKAIF